MKYYLINKKSKVAIEMLFDKTKHSHTQCELILQRMCLLLGSDWHQTSGTIAIDPIYTVIPAS